MCTPAGAPRDTAADAGLAVDAGLPLRMAPADPVDPPVADPPALAAAARRIAAGTGPVAIDAERASGYRYDQRAYLIQLRRAGAGTVLIDPTPFTGAPRPAAMTLEPLSAAITGTEWVIHAARQDLPCLVSAGLVPDLLFDTELAARLLNRPRVGLAHLVASEFGVALAKEHSAADWSTRPLPQQWLDYAALDVEFLLPLRDVLAAELDQRGRMDWARQEFAALTAEAHTLAADGPPVRTDPWRRTSGLHRVRNPGGLAIVRALWLARDAIARAQDCAPHRLLPDSAIVEVALAAPSGIDIRPLLTGPGTRRGKAHVSSWLAAVAEAMGQPSSEHPPRRPEGNDADPPPARFWRERNPDAAARLLGVRGAVADRASLIDLPADVLIAPEVLRRLCWSATLSPDPAPEEISTALVQAGARSWQAMLVADCIAAALRA